MYLEMPQDSRPGHLAHYAWSVLGGIHSIDSPLQHEHIRNFFERVDDLIAAGTTLSYQRCYSILQQLSADKQSGDGQNVQIMTVHKSKGLEFDHVIIYALEKSKPTVNKPLIDSHTIISSGLTTHFLHSYPRQQSRMSSLQSFLRTQTHTAQQEEQIRLAYVALTRARACLHLFTLATERPSSSSWTALLQPHLHTGPCAVAEHTVLATDRVDISPAPVHSSLRSVLAQQWQPAAPQPLRQRSPIAPVHWQWQESPPDTAAVRGEIVHAYMQCAHEQGGVELLNPDTLLPLLCADLGYLSWLNKPIISELGSALRLLNVSVRARWIFSTTHRYIMHEHPWIDSRNQLLRSDRSFIDEHGTLWLIDFKTRSRVDMSLMSSTPDYSRYHDQLQNYARIYAEFHPRIPIQIAIYLPLEDRWWSTLYSPEESLDVL